MASVLSLPGWLTALLRPFSAGVLAVAVLAGCSDESKVDDYTARGDTHFKEARFDRAELEYLNVLRIDSENTHASARLGSIYYEQGRNGRALPLLLLAVQMNPEDTETRVRLCTLLLASGNHEHALRHALEIIARVPESPLAPVLLAEASVLPDTIEATMRRLKDLPRIPATHTPILIARGILALRSGEFGEAERLFDSALRAAPDSSEAHTGKGACLEAQGNLIGARDAYTRAAQAEGAPLTRRLRLARFYLQVMDLPAAREVLDSILRDSPAYVPALIRRGELALAQGDTATAETLLAGALRLDETHPEALLLSGRMHIAAEAWDKALQPLTHYVSLYPDAPDGHVELARIYLQRRQTRQAAASLNRALGLSPGHVQGNLLQATLQIRQGDRIAALQRLRAVLQDHPALVEAHILLADAHRGEGHLAEALSIYERLETVAQENERVLFLKGIVLLGMDRGAAARAAFEQALARRPDFLPPLEQLIALQIAERDLAGARQRVEGALAHQPDNADLHVLSAKVAFASKRFEAVEPALNRALELRRDHVVAYAMLASFHLASGDGVRALNSLDAIAQADPKEIGALMLAAILREQRGEHAQAREAYEKILAVDPRFAPALNNLAYLCLEQFGDPETAFHHAHLARELAPADPYIADTLGWVLYRRGDYSWALWLLRDSAERLPRSADVQYHLGLASYMLGDEPAARSALETALRLNPRPPLATDIAQRLSILDCSPVPDRDEPPASAEAFLREQPGDPVALDRLARFHLVRGRPDAALSLYQTAVAKNPQNLPLLLSLIQLTSTLGDDAGALAHARRARELAPDDSRIAAVLGGLTFKAGDHAGAHNLFLEAVRQNAQDPLLLFQLSEAAYSLGRIEETRSWLSRLIEVAPAAPVASAARDRLSFLDQAGSLSVTSAGLERAKRRLQERPDDVAAMMVVAAGARTRGASAEERSVLEAALRVYPSFTPALRHLAILLATNPSEDQRTLEIGTLAHAAFPDDILLACELGKVSYRRGDLERTILLLEDVVPRLPGDPVAWYALGMAQGRLQRHPDAREALNKALVLGLAEDLAAEARQQLAASR